MNYYSIKISILLVFFFLLGSGGYSVEIYGDTQDTIMNGMVEFTTDSNDTETSSTTTDSNDTETSSTTTDSNDTETSSTTTDSETSSFSTNTIKMEEKKERNQSFFHAISWLKSNVSEKKTISQKEKVYPRTGEDKMQSLFIAFLGVGIIFILSYSIARRVILKRKNR